MLAPEPPPLLRCWICFETSGTLRSYCACRSDIAAAHAECAEAWAARSDRDPKTCIFCDSPYRVPARNVWLRLLARISGVATLCWRTNTTFGEWCLENRVVL